ncbi:MAG: glutathione S-transferase family protein [Alphaproteobacteria bacterium]|nr:glutathione S-transferase family protein [Alphaproteobacteria bacterium]
MKLYHCKGARSLRAVWMLEEMGLAYDLVVLPFPPRVFQKDYLGINPLGTIPWLEDGDVRMSESSGICHYLGETYGPTPLVLKPGEGDYGAYINWMFFSDATATFPQTLVLRYTQLEPEERRVPQVVEDYTKWFLGRMRFVDAALAGRDYLVAGRFTAADIAVGYAVYLAKRLKIDADLSPRIQDWYARLTAREAFKRADARK